MAAKQMMADDGSMYQATAWPSCQCCYRARPLTPSALRALYHGGPLLPYKLEYVKKKKNDI